MSEQTTEEIIEEAEVLLDLLPSPAIKFERSDAEVYAGNIVTTTPTSLVGEVVKIADCAIEFDPELEDILALHCDMQVPLNIEDIDEDFIEEMGIRNAQFFAGAPEMIRKLGIRLYELNKELRSGKKEEN